MPPALIDDEAVAFRFDYAARHMRRSDSRRRGDARDTRRNGIFALMLGEYFGYEGAEVILESAKLGRHVIRHERSRHVCACFDIRGRFSSAGELGERYDFEPHEFLRLFSRLSGFGLAGVGARHFQPRARFRRLLSCALLLLWRFWRRSTHARR